MIRIQNVRSPLPTDPPASAERETVLASLSARPTTFDSPGALQFELRFREQTIRAARSLNASGAAFATFEKTRGNPEYWSVSRSGALRLRPDRKPSDAIRDIYANGPAYAFECATAIVIVLYKAALDTLGEETYNRLFARTVLYDWHVDADLGLATVPERTFIPGDALYFDNPDVDPATPQWQGENVIDLGEGLYYGHGIGIGGADVMIAALNERRRPGARRSAYLLNQATRPNYARLYREAAALPRPYAYAPEERLPSGLPVRALIGSVAFLAK